MDWSRVNDIGSASISGLGSNNVLIDSKLN